MVLPGSLRGVADVRAAEEEESATPAGMKGRVCSTARARCRTYGAEAVSWRGPRACARVNVWHAYGAAGSAIHTATAME